MALTYKLLFYLFCHCLDGNSLVADLAAGERNQGHIILKPDLCRGSGFPVSRDERLIDKEEYKFDNMAQAQVNQKARPWDPKFTHADRERWVCIYPAYINSKKSVKEGRRIPKEKAVDNPSCYEIRDVCLAAGLQIGVENKTYCRELEHKDIKYRGRIRVQIKNEDGSFKYEKFQDKKSVMLHLGEMIPKLKTRQGGQGGSQAGSQQQQGGKQQKKKGRKGK